MNTRVVDPQASQLQPQPFSMQALYEEFEVTNTTELRKNGFFRGLTHGMGKFDFRFKATWQRPYQKFSGILPDEHQEHGYSCIHGINIFNDLQPWEVFNLNAKW